MIFNKSENNISQKKIDNFKKNQWKMNKIIDISETQFLPGHHTIFGGGNLHIILLFSYS